MLLSAEYTTLYGKTKRNHNTDLWFLLLLLLLIGNEVHHEEEISLYIFTKIGLALSCDIRYTETDPGDVDGVASHPP